MSIFDKFDANLEQAKDSVGGYQPLESGAYDARIKTIYITMSKSGAMAANVVMDIDGREYREQIWISNSKGENFYVKDGHKIPLPGFTALNDICLCTVGKKLCELDTETRVFNVYDWEAKSELPKEVPTIVDLLDAEVTVGIIHQTVDKNVKDASGNYVPSGETRDENVIDKVFNSETHMTVNEVKEGKTEATFYNNWLKKNQGVIRNRAKGKKGTSKAVASPAKPSASPLFG